MPSYGGGLNVGGRDNPSTNKIVKVDSLNCNYFTLNNSYIGIMDISGRLNVSKDINSKGNLYTYNSYAYNNMVCANEFYNLKDAFFYGNVDISGNTNIYYGYLNVYTGLNIKNDMSIRNHLYLGYNDASYISYLRSDGSGHLGIDTDTPLSTLDVYGKYSPNVLTVRSDTSSNNNVVAMNDISCGIVLSTTHSNSTISFYNETPIYDGCGNIQAGDAAIQYSTGGTLTLDASVNAAILSNVSIGSNAPNTNSHIANETASIYANFSGTYGYDAYENATVHTGNAITAVSNDVSSNAFLNMVTPNNLGMGIGGGSYPPNTKVSFGTIGVYNSDGTYQPSIHVVRGNSLVKMKTTVGINTYAPMMNDCALNVNGPIYLTNGEITKTVNTNFEILNMGVSRNYPNTCIAVGSAYTLSGDVINGGQFQYYHKILYSNGSGETWSVSDLRSNLNVNLDKTPFTSVSVYDMSFAVAVSQTNVLYTINGGKTWTNITGIPTSSFNSVYIDQNMCIFITATSQTNVLYWFNTPSDIYTGTSFGITSINPINQINLSFTPTSCNGYGFYVYLLSASTANSINRFNKTTNTIDVTYNSTSYVYNSVSAYQSSVVAVGNNVIAWSSNAGFTWTNIPIVNTTFNSVYVYDNSNAIAVANGGIIYYATNGIQNWSILPTSSFNPSGNSARVMDPSFNLSAVVMNDLNRINIAKVITSYNDTNRVYGNTSVYHAYMPNIFNADNNIVLDACGTVRISGNLQVHGGKLSASNTTFSMLDLSVNTLTLASNASSISMANAVNSRVSVNYNFTVGHDTSMNGNLSVQNYTYSSYYEGIAPNTDIRIGTKDLCGNIQRVVFINNDNTPLQSTYDTIKLGGGYDTIVMPSKGAVNVNNINTGKIIYINRLSLDGTQNYNNGSSNGTGLHIVDNSNLDAGLFVVSNDLSGYIFKAPGSANKVKLDVNSLNLSTNNNINCGVVTLKNTSGGQTDSNYTMGVWSIDISNILLKNYSLSNTVTNIQVVDTSLGILGNAYVGNSFSVGKTTTTPGINVDVSGNIVCSHLGILTNSVNPKYSTEISGNIFHNPGYLWQF